MTAEKILETLIVEFYSEMQSAKDCSRLGYDQLADQARHQAIGIRTAAESLGIHAETFMNAYRDYRKKMRTQI